jgi:hypothetical protein
MLMRKHTGMLNCVFLIPHSAITYSLAASRHYRTREGGTEKFYLGNKDII